MSENPARKRLEEMFREMISGQPSGKRVEMVMGDKTKNLIHARNALAKRLAESMEAATCTMCGKKYEGAWPVFRGEPLDVGWNTWREGEDMMNTHFAMTCPTCCPPDHHFTTKLLHSAEAIEGGLMEAQVMGMHMDDLDFDVREKLMRQLKKAAAKRGIDNVRLKFTEDQTNDEISARSSQRYFRRLCERALNENRCVSCGMPSSEPIPEGAEHGTIYDDGHFCLVQIASLADLVPMCGSCGEEEGLMRRDGTTRRGGSMLGLFPVHEDD